MTQLLTKRELSQKLKLSTRTIDRRVAAGDFPRGLKVGAAVRWPEEEIDRWVAGRTEDTGRRT